MNGFIDDLSAALNDPGYWTDKELEDRAREVLTQYECLTDVELIGPDGFLIRKARRIRNQLKDSSPEISGMPTDTVLEIEKGGNQWETVPADLEGMFGVGSPPRRVYVRGV